MWPFNSKPNHKVQVTRIMYRDEKPRQTGISEEHVKRLDNGLVYFCMTTYGSRKKVFINSENIVEEADESKIFLGFSHKIIPLTWPVDKPCPLFEEAT